ncbi:hypothetical protein D9757_005287 [Collybiopsis confluens]|uniref:Heme haloperoxidase family profile domain-containing protein n=1 Tax=Collybiopsis confluens TaxID=2823264 RepID=A0A8H5MDU1_9AGAR|nr:hypothetical protein D9757_005287 [Collybiopsis confluens]
MTIFGDAYIFTWDFFLALFNAVTPNLKEGHVVPEGHPGAGGKWPEYVPPGEGDSRSACPMLNALANHGILPHDGKNIPFSTLADTVHSTYNFAPSFCYFAPYYIANFLKKDYSKDTVDLAEISAHNGIEHDASLTREDTFHEPDQGKPHVPYIEELLSMASGKDPKIKADDPKEVLLTLDDIARYSAKRRTEAKERNPDSSGFLRIFGGRVSDLRPFLIEERIPQGWESSVRARKGMTLAKFNFTVLPLEFRTKKYMKELAKKDK